MELLAVLRQELHDNRVNDGWYLAACNKHAHLQTTLTTHTQTPMTESWKVLEGIYIAGINVHALHMYMCIYVSV